MSQDMSKSSEWDTMIGVLSRCPHGKIAGDDELASILFKLPCTDLARISRDATGEWRESIVKHFLTLNHEEIFVQLERVNPYINIDFIGNDYKQFFTKLESSEIEIAVENIESASEGLVLLRATTMVENDTNSRYLAFNPTLNYVEFLPPFDKFMWCHKKGLTIGYNMGDLFFKVVFVAYKRNIFQGLREYKFWLYCSSKKEFSKSCRLKMHADATFDHGVYSNGIFYWLQKNSQMVSYDVDQRKCIVYTLLREDDKPTYCKNIFEFNRKIFLIEAENLTQYCVYELTAARIWKVKGKMNLQDLNFDHIEKVDLISAGHDDEDGMVIFFVLNSSREVFLFNSRYGSVENVHTLSRDLDLTKSGSVRKFLARPSMYFGQGDVKGSSRLFLKEYGLEVDLEGTRKVLDVGETCFAIQMTKRVSFGL